MEILYMIPDVIKKSVRSILNKNKRLHDRHKLVGSPDRMKRDFQVNFLKLQGLQRSDYLLDIGCGTLRGGIPLIRYLDRGHYYGVEARDAVLQEGLNELKESRLENKAPTLESGNFESDINFNRKFDYLWAYSVLIHMQDEILDSCFKFVSAHLHPEGVFFANVNIGTKADGNWEEFPVVHRSLNFYEDMADKYGLRVKDIGPISDFGHHSGKPQDRQRMLKISY